MAHCNMMNLEDEFQGECNRKHKFQVPKKEEKKYKTKAKRFPKYIHVQVST
jgi:hypothetical protein